MRHGTMEDKYRKGDYEMAKNVCPRRRHNLTQF